MFKDFDAILYGIY